MRGSNVREFNDSDLIVALKALADPNRFRMVQEIAAAGELSCSQVNERFDLSQPTVSHHIKLLIEAKILQSRPDGKHHFLSVDEALLDKVAALLPARLAPDAKHRTRAAGRR
jgi:ArsR family transcriptional regulator